VIIEDGVYNLLEVKIESMFVDVELLSNDSIVHADNTIVWIIAFSVTFLDLLFYYYYFCSSVLYFCKFWQYLIWVFM